MKRHILPIATHIHGHFNAIQQGQEISVFPPSVAKRMLCKDCAPEIVPRVWIVIKI